MLLLLLPALLAGCVSGEGPVTTEIVAVGEVEGVRNASFADVVVTATPGTDAIVTCEANLHEHLRFDRDGDLLVLGTRGGVAFLLSEPCTVEIGAAVLTEAHALGSGAVRATGPLPGLRTVTVAAGGELALDDVEGTDVSVDVGGTGRATISRLTARSVALVAAGDGLTRLTGATRELSVVASGFGDVDASALAAEEVRVEASGFGDVVVAASVTADVRLTGEGDVVVYGGGEVDAVDLGAGEILVR